MTCCRCVHLLRAVWRGKVTECSTTAQPRCCQGSAQLPARGCPGHQPLSRGPAAPMAAPSPPTAPLRDPRPILLLSSTNLLAASMLFPAGLCYLPDKNKAAPEWFLYLVNTYMLAKLCAAEAVSQEPGKRFAERLKHPHSCSQV